MDKSQRLAAHAVSEVLAGRNLSQVLENIWQSHAQLTQQQRAITQDLSYGALRNLGQLQAILQLLVTRPLQDERVHSLLLVALYQLEYGKSAQHAVVDHAVRAASHLKKAWVKGLVNAVLRNYLRQREVLLQKILQNEVAVYSYPQWWINKLKQQYPLQWQGVLEAGNQRPPLTLRVNLRRCTVAGYLQKLADVGIAARELGNEAIMLEHPVSVDKLPGFYAGDVSVQDYGAQYAARLLDIKDGMRVLDACCAPGGKTGHLLEIANVEMTAIDEDGLRIDRTLSNLQRLALEAEVKVADAGDAARWWDGVPFERILADVPCSASGIVRRHADIKWLRRERDLESFGQQQARILSSLWQLLAKGGKLLYVTCSVFAEENQCQIDTFLKQQADAHQTPLLERAEGQLLPCTEHDGFFYALLQKN